MEPGFYAHQNSLDMIIEVFEVKEHKEFFDIKFYCWNKSYCGNPWRIDTEPFKAKIYKENLHCWRKYVDATGRI